MKVIFYDRKNKREVSSEELHFTNFVEYYATVDDDDEKIPTGRRILESGEPLDRAAFIRAIEGGYLQQKGKIPEWDKLPEEKTPRVLYVTQRQIASLHYKSEKCPSYVNGDLHLHPEDLIFLRLEDDTKTASLGEVKKPTP